MTGPAGPALAAVIAAGAVLCWPARPLADARPGRRRRVAPPSVSAAGVVVVSGGTALLVGVAAAVAAALLGLTLRRALLAASLARRQHRGRIATAAALASLARELRAGTEPAAALTEVARHTDPAVAALFSGAARGIAPHPVVAGRVDVAARLVAGLHLAQQHGVRFAALVDAIARDLAGARERTTQVAGPRFSGWVLAVLPAFGLLLGTGMGAEPLRVLLTTTAGNVLLVSGVALVCTGLLWAERLVRP